MANSTAVSATSFRKSEGKSSIRRSLKAARYAIVLWRLIALGLLLATLALASAMWPKLFGSSFTLVLFAFLLSSMFAVSLSRQQVLPVGPRQRPTNVLSCGVAWLLCFAAIVATVLLQQFIERWIDLESRKICSEEARGALASDPGAIALAYPNGICPPRPPAGESGSE
jgi:hypothetical protein